MRKRFILLILSAIGCLSVASFISLLFYFDPYIYPVGALSLLIISFFLALTSFVTLLFYFFKKIYYRGEVGIYHVLSSLRQAFFLSLLGVGIGTIVSFHIPLFIPILLLCSIIMFLELFIQSL